MQKNYRYFISAFLLLQLLLVNSVSSKSNSKIQDKAVALKKSADSYYISQLYDDEKSIYEQDIDFLNAFSFNEYKLVSVPNQGKFFINDIDDTIKNRLRDKKPWEIENQEIIQKYVKEKSIALDIGSHIGTHTVAMSKCVGKKGKVFAFEPNKIIYRELCYNLAANGCNNVYPMRLAVGKNKQPVEVIFSHPNNEGGSYVVEAKDGDNLAFQFPLDAFNFTNISFMKIDVENMEKDVLEGAELTILSSRPVILIEIQGNGERPSQLNEDTVLMALMSIEKIESLGYQLIYLRGADYLALPR
jgi:FkbM family methyltransferase